MLYIIISTIVMLGFLDRSLRRGHLDKLKLKTRFELFAFRDELRLALIRGEVAPGRWFDYLDTTLTKSIDNLDDINLWESIALLLSYSKDPAIEAAIAKQAEELRDPANHRLLDLQTKFTSCLARFLMKRHFGMLPHNREPEQAKVPLVEPSHPEVPSPFSDEPEVRIRRPLWALVKGFFRPNIGFVRIFTSAPQTSTLVQYAGTS